MIPRPNNRAETLGAIYYMDLLLLTRHIGLLDKAGAHWTQELIESPPVVLGDVVRNKVTQKAGVYVVRNDSELVYIGKSVNLRTRICSQHLGPRKRSSTLRRKVSKHLQTDDEDQITEWLRTTTIGWIELGHHGLTLAVEDYAIAKYNPPFNGYT